MISVDFAHNSYHCKYTHWIYSLYSYYILEMEIYVMYTSERDEYVVQLTNNDIPSPSLCFLVWTKMPMCLGDACHSH